MEMLARVFLMVLNRGVEISCVILVVLAARLLLLKCPKKYSYFLWLLVVVRIVIPVGVFSLFPSLSIFNLPAVGEAQERIVAAERQFRTFGEEDGIADISDGAYAESLNHVMPVTGGPQNVEGSQSASFWGKENRNFKPDMFRVVCVLAAVWLLGMIVLCLYSVISYVLLRRKISSAVLLRDNVYECDNIATPFVIGVFNPKIYIPFRLDGQERKYILHHENCHIRRKDYFIKVSAFLVTVVYWFHPLVWLAFFLMTRDMEMSCDEKVIMELGMDEKSNYGRLLLAFAANRRSGVAGPLAFGEGDTKRRVKNVLDIRKPQFFAVAAAVAVLAAAGVLCLTGRADSEDERNSLKVNSDGENQAEVSDEVKAFVENWAQNFCTRNGEGLIASCENGVGENIPFMYSASGRGFGMSSPWPQGDMPYEIRKITESGAVIFYYAMTSDPHVWTWREEIKFRGEGENLLVYEEKMTGVDDVHTAEEMRLLYPDGRISGTMMDYRTNGLGTDLQQNYLLGKSAGNALVHPEKAAAFLLNVAVNNTILTGIYELEEDRRAEVVLYFSEENEAVLVTLERIKDFKAGWSGIWVPVEIHFMGHDETLIHDVMVQNTKHELVTAGKVQYREIDLKLDNTMPPYNIIEGNYIDGDFLDDFYYPYQRKMFIFSRELMDCCDSEDLAQWYQRYSLHIPASNLENSGNLYAFISDFGFTDEEVRKACSIERETMRTTGEDYENWTFSDNEINILFSGSEEEITKQFASPYAIVLGKYAYSPLWMYTHTIEDYETVGITKEMVREKVAYYEGLLQLPLEAKEAFAAKINEFLEEDVMK